MLLCESAIGGRVVLVVGAGLAIAVGVGDCFLGDKIWSEIIKSKNIWLRDMLFSVLWK
jgi:NAD-dependent SIR2 family protein deacetylase